MRNRPPLRPALEPLDSRLLPSAMAPAGMGRSVAPAHVRAGRVADSAAPPVATVALHGTVPITLKLVNKSGDGTVTGSGDLGAVGNATVYARDAAGHDPGRNLVLSTRLGKIHIKGGDQPSILINDAGVAGTNSYTVTGGTGSYAHATGSGTYSLNIPSDSIRVDRDGHGSRAAGSLTFS